MFRQRVIIIYLALTIMILALATVVLWFGFFNVTIPPYSVPEGYTLTPRVESGGRLRFAFRIIRRRVCAFHIDRYITKSSDASIIWQQRSQGGATPLGDDWLAIDIPLPELPLGHYLYQTTITNHCDDGIFITRTPIVRFEVVSQGNAAPVDARKKARFKVHYEDASRWRKD